MGSEWVARSFDAWLTTIAYFDGDGDFPGIYYAITITMQVYEKRLLLSRTCYGLCFRARHLAEVCTPRPRHQASGKLELRAISKKYLLLKRAELVGRKPESRRLSTLSYNKHMSY